MGQGCEKYLRGELERGQVACTWSNAFLHRSSGGYGHIIGGLLKSTVKSGPPHTDCSLENTSTSVGLDTFVRLPFSDILSTCVACFAVGHTILKQNVATLQDPPLGWFGHDPGQHNMEFCARLVF